MASAAEQAGQGDWKKKEASGKMKERSVKRAGNPDPGAGHFYFRPEQFISAPRNFLACL